MVQGCLDWARQMKDKRAAMWMNKFWSRICCEVHSGKEQQQALEDAEKDYKIWSSPEQTLKRKRDGECEARKGFKSWVEDDVLSQIDGWHML
ncbi:g4038 [Coccomyxa elongata]